MTVTSSGNDNDCSIVTESYPSNTPDKPVILDACLTYIKFSLKNHDQAYVQDVVIEKFVLSAIRDARERLFRYCAPTVKYDYRGPLKSSHPRVKSLHALQYIFTKLKELDSINQVPSIACPSDQLQSLLQINERRLHDDRLQKLEGEINGLKQLSSSHNDLKNLVTSLLNSRQVPISQPVNDDPQRSRSASVSVKRKSESNQPSPDVMEVESEGEFKLPSYQRKQLERRDLKRQRLDIPIPGALAQSTPKRLPPKPQAVWGKSSTSANTGFGGAVPQAFIFSCAIDTEPEKVKSHLITRGIKVTDVKLASHKDAFRKSFVITVESISDYESLLSGEHIPKFVRVREYIPPRSNVNSRSWDTAARKPSFMNNPQVIPSPVTKFQHAINGIEKLDSTLMRENELAAAASTALTAHAIKDIITSVTTDTSDAIHNTTN